MLLRVAALLLSAAAAAQADQDATICGTKIFGDVTDSLMYNANAWNKKSPDGGFSCLKVDNSTPAFDATWNWPEDISDVHSFPYVRFGNAKLPIRLSNLNALQLSTEWIMTAGSPKEAPRIFTSSAMASNEVKLNKKKVQANAAWDLFLDSNRNTSLYPQYAAIELMVWLGTVGDPWWLGRQNNTILSNLTLGKTEFSLYYGRNSGGTHVFTAVTSDGENVNSLDTDFYPLFEYLLKEAGDNPEIPDDLPKDPYLGLVEFGSETWYSDGNVTFSAANFAMKLDGEEEEEDGNSTSSGSSGQNGDGDDDGDDEDGAGVLGVTILSYVIPLALAANFCFS